MLRTKEKPLASDIRLFMKDHNVKQELAAEILEMTVRQIYRYVKGLNTMSAANWYWLRREVLEMRAQELRAKQEEIAKGRMRSK